MRNCWSIYATVPQDGINGTALMVPGIPAPMEGAAASAFSSMGVGCQRVRLLCLASYHFTNLAKIGM